MAVNMDTFPLDNTTYNADDLGMWFATRTSGVLSTGTNLAVSAPGNMTVTVAPGLCWLKMADDWGVAARLPSTETLTIANGDSLKYRIDNIVVRLDRVLNKTVTAVVAGTLASSKVLAVPPAPARNANVYEIVIARVSVDKGITTIKSGMISDTRLDANICGIVRDGITGIDTSVLQAQATAEIAKIDALLEQTVIDGLPDGSITTAKFASTAKAPSAVTADSIPWTSVTSKPPTFTPSTHTHVTSDINSGVFGVGRGGTGTTTLTSGAVLLGNGTGAITSTSILPVSKGGTGVATLPSSSILMGNGTGVIQGVGSLWIEKGGTGGTTRNGALTSLQARSLGIGTLIITSTNLNNIITVGNYYCNTVSIVTTLVNCPVTSAFTMNVGLANGTTDHIYQEIIEFSTGTRYFRRYAVGEPRWYPWYKTHDDSTTLSVADGGTGAKTLASGSILMGNGTGAIQAVGSLWIDKGGTGGTTAATARTSLGVPAVSETVTKTTSLTCNVVASGSIVVNATNGDALIKQGLPAGPIYCCTATHYNDVSGDPNYIIATRAYSGSIWARYNSNITGVVRINYIIYKVV